MTDNSLIDDGFTAGEPQVCTSLRLVFQSDRSSTDPRVLRTPMTVTVSLFQKEGPATGTEGHEAEVEDNSTDWPDMPL